jgi:hypothetical protein
MLSKHGLLTMHIIKRISEITIQLVKKAPIPTRITIDINAGTNTIESAAKADIKVPKIPASKQLIFCLRHFNNIFDSVLTATNIAVTKIIRVKTANPNAIQTEVTINGINPNANNMPIITPTTILIGIPINPQTEGLYLPL